MRKNLLIYVLSLSVILGSFFACGVHCRTATADVIDASGDELPYVIDNADLLSDFEEAELEKRISLLADEYQMDIVILTENSIGDKTPMEYADDYFDYNGYGYGDSEDGILFLLSMADRDWYISTAGDGIRVFTDYSIDVFEDTIVKYFSDADYYEGFDRALDLCNNFLYQARVGVPYDTNNRYDADNIGEDDAFSGTDYSIDVFEDTIVKYFSKALDLCNNFLYQARVGVPYDTNNRYDADNIGEDDAFSGIVLPILINVSIGIVLPILIGVSIGFVIALVIVFGMKRAMKTARPQDRADSYVKAGSMMLRVQQDIFLYRNVSRVRRQSESGGGSSTHTSSSGSSHGGGGGKF